MRKRMHDIRAVILLLLGLYSPALAQTNGYIGIYADAAGTAPCLNVLPYTAAVLHVIATCEGLTASGITGAEFRIEVSNPAGWWFTYNTPSPATVLGNPLDTSPGPGDISGVNIGFTACQTPTNGKVALGTISVFNSNGSATNLLVKRHNTPRNPDYSCALFTRCDSPVYSKQCMTAMAAGVCSTLTAPTKAVIASAEEPVFTLLVNGIASPPPTGDGFTESLSLEPSALYVNGYRVQGMTVDCVFDGQHFAVGGVDIALQVVEQPPSAEMLAAIYGNVPSVSARITDGLTIAAAVEVFEAERLALLGQAALAIDANDFDGARAVLESSPLVASVVVNEARKTVRIRYHGMSSDSAIEPGYYRGTPDVTAPEAQDIGAVARKYMASIRRGLHSNTPGGMLLLLWRGVVSKYSGPVRDQAQAQIDHILAGGSVATAPQGPLTTDQLQGFVQDVGN